jgi:hypothetical protein
MAKKPPKPLDLYEIEQIKVLKASGLSYNAVAKKVGRDHKTIKRCCMNPRNAEEIKTIQRELAGYFEDLTVRFITSISDEDIKKLNGYQRVIAAGIAVDKFRLLRNESTENISINAIHSRREDRNKRTEELRREREKMTGVDEDVEQEKQLALEDKTHNPIDDVEKVVEIPNE